MALTQPQEKWLRKEVDAAYRLYNALNDLRELRNEYDKSGYSGAFTAANINGVLYVRDDNSVPNAMFTVEELHGFLDDNGGGRWTNLIIFLEAVP